MQAKKDNTTEGYEDGIEGDESDKGDKKAKIKRFIQIAIGIIGISFMIYSVMFSSDEQNLNPDVQSSTDTKNPSPPPEKVDFGKDLINIDSKTKGSITPKDIKEFDIPSSVQTPSLPKVSAPDVPPLPDFKFTKPYEPKKIEESKQDSLKVTPPMQDTTPSSDKPVDNIQNPDAIIEEKKNLNMFAFSSGADGGSYSTPKTTNLNKDGEKDLIIYDKSRLIEVSNADLTKTNATVTQAANLENMIAQGKMMDVVLETAINSELPGPIRGLIVRDVFGEAGVKVLIPKGTRVYGTYSTKVTRGQSRLSISWNRVIRPDGVSVSMTAQASDQFGRIGVEGDVDNRYSEIFGNSLLLSFANLGTAIALEKIAGNTGQSQIANSNGSISTTNINPINMAASTVINDVSTVVNSLTQGALALSPIVTIPQGTRLTVIVNQDIVVPDYIKQSL